jgi:hypothetical protein
MPNVQKIKESISPEQNIHQFAFLLIIGSISTEAKNIWAIPLRVSAKADRRLLDKVIIAI